MTAPTMEITNIVDKGDVILVVGNGDNIRKLKVDIHMLRAASTTFSAFFGPNFSEGQNLDYEHPKEVELEDDDPAAMEYICNVIHHKADKPRYILSQQLHPILLPVAQIVDKYALYRPLSAYMHIHIMDLLSPTQMLGIIDDYVDLLKVASLQVMEDERAYLAVTYAVVMQVPLNAWSPDITLTTSSDARLCGWYELVAKRLKFRSIVVEAMFTATLYISSLQEACSCMVKYQQDFIEMIEQHCMTMPMIAERSLSQCFEAGQKLWRAITMNYTCNWCNMHNVPLQRGRSLQQALEPLRNFKGLELPKCKHHPQSDIQTID